MAINDNINDNDCILSQYEPYAGQSGEGVPCVLERSQHRDIEGDHGRIETRTTTVFHDVAWLEKRHNWPGLKSRAVGQLGKGVHPIALGIGPRARTSRR